MISSSLGVLFHFKSSTITAPVMNKQAAVDVKLSSYSTWKTEEYQPLEVDTSKD